MQFMRGSALGALVAAIATLTAAAPAADSSGKALFTVNGCTQCHGTLGQGNKSAGVRLAPHPIPYAAFVSQLRKPRGEMPPYSAHIVSDRDAAAMYAYLQSIHDGKTAAQIPLLTAVGDGNAARPPGTDGLAAGRAIFAQSCASHGAAGVGGGLGPALTAERTRKNLAATVTFIKHPLAPMPTLFPGKLSERDVADVAAYVQSL
jgi:mono/diheme cytochrome c family protein